MRVKSFLWLMIGVSLVSWLSFLSVIKLIDPTAAGFFGLLLFYLSLFFALSGSLALLGFYLRYIFTRTFPVFEQAQIAFRQATFFSLVVIATLFLQAQDLLSWINAMLLVFFFASLEFLIISLKKN